MLTGIEPAYAERHPISNQRGRPTTPTTPTTPPCRHLVSFSPRLVGFPGKHASKYPLVFLFDAPWRLGQSFTSFCWHYLLLAFPESICNSKRQHVAAHRRIFFEQHSMMSRCTRFFKFPNLAGKRQDCALLVVCNATLEVWFV